MKLDRNAGLVIAPGERQTIIWEFILINLHTYCQGLSCSSSISRCSDWEKNPSSTTQLQPSKTSKRASVIQTLSSGVLCGSPQGLNCTGSSGVMNTYTELAPAAQRQCQLQSQPINIFTIQRYTLSQLQNQHKSIGRQNTTGT